MSETPLLSNLTEAAEELGRRNKRLDEAEKAVRYAVEKRDKAREAAADAELTLADMVGRCIPELRHTAGDKLAAERLRVIDAASWHLAGGREEAMTTDAASVSHDLGRLLDPRDPLDVPTPGFPSGEAVVAWAQAKPLEAVVPALLDVLRFDGLQQQSMAAAILRALGYEVDGLRNGGDFRWQVRGSGLAEGITPSALPPLPLTPPTREEPIQRSRRLAEEIRLSVRRLQDFQWDEYLEDRRAHSRIPELA